MHRSVVQLFIDARAPIDACGRLQMMMMRTVNA
jgi:hypothetical protein